MKQDWQSSIFQGIYFLYLIRRFVSELIEYAFISTWKSRAWIREKLYHCQKEPKRKEHEHRRKINHIFITHIMKVYGTLPTNPPIITPWIASQVKKNNGLPFNRIALCMGLYVWAWKRWNLSLTRSRCFSLSKSYRIRNSVTTRFLCSVSTEAHGLR